MLYTIAERRVVTNGGQCRKADVQTLNKFFDESVKSSHKVTQIPSDIKFYNIFSKFLPNFAGDVVIEISPNKDKLPSI